jgi:hypothetical protein
MFAERLKNKKQEGINEILPEGIIPNINNILWALGSLSPGVKRPECELISHPHLMPR